MDLFRHGMKGPARPAPGVPSLSVNRYSPVTNWSDDPFGSDVFEPTPHYMQKKQPPPRPPPPKINSKQPEIPLKPSHFVRKPTVLSSLLSRKNKSVANNQNVNINSQNIIPMDMNCDLDTNKMFPRCEPKNVQTGALIDLSSPPSSPTFTTRSSSDGLSVDSFGSDATTSTNHHNVQNGGSASQAESGFEDDFDLFLHSRKAISKDDTLDDFTSIDPFSPQPVTKPPIMKKPVLNRDLFDVSSKATSQPQMLLLKGPTIIRAKPARPKPPDNSALLKNTFGSSFPVTPMHVNTTTPIQKVCNFGDSFESKPFCWDQESSPERESSPPMPSIPPPPPPAAADLPLEWPEEPEARLDTVAPDFGDTEDPESHLDTVAPVFGDTEEPYAIALFDYFTDHPDDLCFSTNSKIKLVRRVDDEWLFGRARSGAEGVFPANYVEIRVPLPGESVPAKRAATAVALYDMHPAQPGDLRLVAGDAIAVMHKINDEWYFGECNGMRGQFPANYVQMS